jgi:hypothetical protein
MKLQPGETLVLKIYRSTYIENTYEARTPGDPRVIGYGKSIEEAVANALEIYAAAPEPFKGWPT